MKKLYIVPFVLLLTQLVYSQQKPQYTQYILNNYILNPALTGIENYIDVKMSARDQWIGINGAPQTAYFSIQGPIGKKDYKTSATSFNIPGGNPRGEGYWDNYRASEPHQGVGMMMVNDRTGNFNVFTADATYAYHLGLSVKTNLAVGFSAGFTRISHNAFKSNFGSGSNVDPAQSNSAIRNWSIKPDLGAGLWLYSSTYFVGVAAQQIIPQKVSFVDDPAYNQGRLVPHLFATAGYRFLLSEDVNALPSIMVKYVSDSPTVPQCDINLKLQYQDLFWIGGSYRLNDGYAGMLGLNVGNTFNIGYAYDFTQTPLNTTSRGTHEIVIGFLIGNRYADTCPRNIW